MSRASALPGSVETSAFAARLQQAVSGGVRFDVFTRGRYATDASFYQIMPLGVVVPRTTEEALAALAIARDEGVPVTARGGGTSQCGQTVNRGLVVDTLQAPEPHPVAGCREKDLRRRARHRAGRPQPSAEAARTVVSRRRLDGLAGHDRRHGRQQLLRRPLAALRHDARQHAVDARRRSPMARCCASDRSRATWRASTRTRRGATSSATCWRSASARPRRSRRAFPKVQRRVGGYNLDALVPNGPTNNMAHVLVGSEGTLAFTTEVELKLWPVIRNRVLGVCHFGSFYEAMDATQHLVTLSPSRSSWWTAR